MGCESAAFIKKARKVYFSLEDEESREIFRKKFLYMITGEDKYWLQIIMNETVSIPQLSWGNNRCKWR